MALNRTIQRSDSILQLLAQSSDGLTLTEIVQTLDIPKSSVFDIVQSLCSIGYVDCVGANQKRYVIGIRLFELGNRFMQNKSIYNVSNDHLKQLSETVNKTAFMGVLRDSKVIYIQKYEPNVSIRTSCVVGSSADVYSTSLGKSLLAFSLPHIQSELLKNIDFVKHQVNTIDNISDLQKDLEKTYHRGYAIDDSENEEGIFCIGAPIFDNTNQVVAAISISGLANPHMDVDYESIVLKKTALQISRELGYTGR